MDTIAIFGRCENCMEMKMLQPRRPTLDDDFKIWICAPCGHWDTEED